MINLLESTILDDMNIEKTDNEILFENILYKMEIDNKFDYGRHKLLKSQLGVLNENFNYDNSFPSNSTSITKWSSTVNDAITQNYKSIKKDYTIKFAKLNKELSDLTNAIKSIDPEKTVYVTNMSLKIYELDNYLKDKYKGLELIEREITSNRSDEDILSYLIALDHSYFGSPYKSSVDLYPQHLTKKEINVSISSCKKLLVTGKKILSYIDKNYIWSAASNKYLPPDSETHYKIVYIITQDLKLMISEILEHLNEVCTIINKVINEVRTIIMEYKLCESPARVIFTNEDTNLITKLVEEFNLLDSELEVEEILSEDFEETFDKNIENYKQNDEDYDTLLDEFI